MREREEILGVGIDVVGLERVLDNLVSMAEGDGACRVFATANPNVLALSRTDAECRRALSQADVIVPDGIGVVLISTLFGGKIRQRIAGPDVAWALLERLQEHREKSFTCFFMGSSDAVLEKLVRVVQQKFPHVRVVGSCSPPFKEVFSEEDDLELVKQINQARPDVLFVGMTAPKQEKWIERNRARLQVKLALSIGAAFDFFAGTKQRAPRWMRDYGAEWFYRFMLEPRRMSRRLFVSGPLFFSAVFLEKMTRRKSKLAR